jgi:ACS family tartrate transporter-like MFS transporter
MIWDFNILILSAYNLLGLTALWGVTYWLPTLLVETGRSIGWAGQLAAIPYVVSIFMAFVISASSDRYQERRWHLVVATVLAGAFMCGAGLCGQGETVTLLVCLTITTGLWFGRITIYWIIVADALPKGAAGPGMAVANGIGNFGGFLGPLMFGWLRSSSGGFDSAMIIGGGFYIAAGLLALLVRTRRPSTRAPAPANDAALGNRSA